MDIINNHFLWFFILLTASTHDQDVFSFYPEDDRYCNGFEEVLSRYREIVPHLRLAGLNFTYHRVVTVLQSHVYLLFCYTGVSILLFCRTNIICSHYWNGHDNCWAKQWSISCSGYYCWWTGIFALRHAREMYDQ